jgi:flagellar basal body-associated protein FliL
MKKVFMVIPVIVVVVVAAFLGAYFLFFQGAKPSEGSSSTSNTGSLVKYKTVSFVDSEGIGTKDTRQPSDAGCRKI